MKIVKKEDEYADLEAEFKFQHFARLQEERDETIATHEIHMELMDNLKQINVYVTEIARSIVDSDNNNK